MMNPLPLDPALLPKLAGAYRLSQCIFVAAKLRIADHLQAGAVHYEALAQVTQTHAPTLRSLMRALASEGVFSEEEPDIFGLTPLSQQLVSETPGSQRDFIVGWVALEATYQAFGGLLHAVKTGENALRHVSGLDFFSYLEHQPEAAQDYNTAMESTTEAFERIAQAYDFSGMRTVVDVGGGSGGFLLALLRHYPHLSGINFDLPPVIAQAEQRGKAIEHEARIKHLAGDFFRSLPAEADAYLLITILHIFDDEHCLTVLNTCRRASTAQAKLLVIDRIRPEGRARAPLALNDLRMQLLSDGHERTETEFRNLFQQAGFHLRRVLPVPEDPYLILEGVPF